MSVSVNSGAVADALKTVDSIIPARLVHHAHGNILLRANDNSLECTASNLDGWLTSIAPANAIEPFTACVDRRVAKVAAGLPEDRDCTLEFKDGAIHLRCGRSRYRFECTPVENFSEAPTLDDSAQFELSADGVGRIFKQAATAISTEETRYYLGGVCLELERDRANAVSTDGHRLIKVVIAAPGAEGLTHRPIIPAKACTTIETMGACTIRIGERLIEARSETQVLIHKLIDGTFPDYGRIILAPSGNSAEIARRDLLDAVERVKHVADRNLKNPAVKLDWSGGDLLLSLPRSPDSAEDIITATTGGSASFCCQIEYLRDLLKAINTGRIALDHPGGGSPIRIAAPSDPDVLAIVMPTRW